MNRYLPPLDELTEETYKYYDISKAFSSDNTGMNASFFTQYEPLFYEITNYSKTGPLLYVDLELNYNYEVINSLDENTRYIIFSMILKYFETRFINPSKIYDR